MNGLFCADVPLRNYSLTTSSFRSADPPLDVMTSDPLQMILYARETVLSWPGSSHQAAALLKFNDIAVVIRLKFGLAMMLWWRQRRLWMFLCFQTYMFPTQDLHGHQSVLEDGTLLISSVQTDDAGVYLCKGLSIAGTAVAKVRLDVQGKRFLCSLYKQWRRQERPRGPASPPWFPRQDINTRLNCINLVRWFAGKSLKLLPPNLVLFSYNAANSISAGAPPQTQLVELTALPRIP